jgi:hypothetical protein
LQRELEALKIEALLEYYKILSKSRNENRLEKIYVHSYCAYRTSQILLNDQRIWRFYSMLPDDYPDREVIYNKIKEAEISLEETKDDSPGRELYDFDNYPGSRKLNLSKKDVSHIKSL